MKPAPNPDPKKAKTFTATLIGAKLNPEHRDQFACTPKAFFADLNDEFDFTFDPCPSNPQFDGLTSEWGERNFVNPPYKYCKKWVKKALEERAKGKLVVMLIPARTNTKWFHKYILEQPDTTIRFIKGKLTFEGYARQAPFASMIVIFKPKQE